MEPQYRIEELTTVGWEDWDRNAPSMIKEDCQELYQQMVGDGTNPNDIRIKRVS